MENYYSNNSAKYNLKYFNLYYKKTFLMKVKIMLKFLTLIFT